MTVVADARVDVAFARAEAAARGAGTKRRNASGGRDGRRESRWAAPEVRSSAAHGDAGR